MKKKKRVYDLYEMAQEFIKLTWGQKFSIGYEMRLIDKNDISLNNAQMDEEIFIEAVQRGLTEKLKKNINWVKNE